MNDEIFKRLYKKLNLIDKNGKILPLHKKCPNCEKCWENAKDRMPKKSHDFWTITRPWIGKNYEQTKLLVIGENMNEYGSYDGAINLVNWAREDIKKGRIKTLKKPSYSGTFLFHRLASYSTAILSKEDDYQYANFDVWPSAIDNNKSFDYLSYTNQIKCSPIGQKSEQPQQMWDNCGDYILKHEIEILKPKSILILGTSDNYKYFNSFIPDESINIDWERNIGTGFANIKGRQTKIYVVPHPASFGGNKKQIMTDIKKHLDK